MLLSLKSTIPFLDFCMAHGFSVEYRYEYIGQVNKCSVHEAKWQEAVDTADVRLQRKVQVLHDNVSMKAGKHCDRPIVNTNDDSRNCTIEFSAITVMPVGQYIHTINHWGKACQVV